jgi:ATP-dependent Clp protease ATP-binding subunit ClpC
MGTLNPDLLSKDVDAVINDAVALKDQFRHQMLTPEVILLALVRRPDTAAARLLDAFKTQRGVDLARLAQGSKRQP